MRKRIGRALILVLYGSGLALGPMAEGREGPGWLLVDLHVEAEQDPCAPPHDPLHCLVCRALDTRSLAGHATAGWIGWPETRPRPDLASSHPAGTAPEFGNRQARAPPGSPCIVGDPF